MKVQCAVCLVKKVKKKVAYCYKVDNKMDCHFVGNIPLRQGNQREFDNLQKVCSKCYLDAKRDYEVRTRKRKMLTTIEPTLPVKRVCGDSMTIENAVVNLELLLKLATQFASGCPLCVSPLKVISITTQGISPKIEAICSKGHPYNWWGSEIQENIKSLNTKIVIASETSGAGFTLMQDVFQVMNMPFISETTYLRKVKTLIPLVNNFVDDHLCEIQKEICEKESSQLQLDEQHSRSQRFTYGQAPYCTTTVIDCSSGLICFQEHASNADVGEVKCKAKLSHTKAMRQICLKINNLNHIVSDRSASGQKSIDTILCPVFPKLKKSLDLWHKTKDFGKTYRVSVCQRVKKRGSFLFPALQKLWFDKKLTGLKFKKHWVYCSENCDKDKKKFKKMWRGAKEHYVGKYNLSDDEVSCLDVWLEKQLIGCEFYLYGFRTNYTEGYHGLCNFFYRKGITLSYEHYVMRKQFALLQWNYSKLDNEKKSSKWKFELSNLFLLM